MNFAAALEYKGDVPKVIAAGRELIARRIIEQAEKHGIPLYRDDALAQILSTIAPGSEIPGELYAAVATVLAHCYRADADFFRQRNSIS